MRLIQSFFIVYFIKKNINLKKEEYEEIDEIKYAVEVKVIKIKRSCIHFDE